jgi:hypothetical protein
VQRKTARISTRFITGNVTPYLVYGFRNLAPDALVGHLVALAQRRAPGEV